MSMMSLLVFKIPEWPGDEDLLPLAAVLTLLAIGLVGFSWMVFG